MLTGVERDEREARLPVWAQNLINTLRREVQNEAFKTRSAETKARQARLDTNPAESSAILWPYSSVPVGLGEEAHVRFKMNGRRWVDVRVSRDGESVEIMGERSLIIRCQSGNVLTITSERW